MNKQQEALVKAVIADYTKEKGKDPQSEKEITDYIKEKGGDKYLQTKLQGLAKKAEHGTKLDFVRALKNQCPEGQELYFYKKGGQVGCGCVGKKLETGGETPENPVDKFKKAVRKKIDSMQSLSEKGTTYDTKTGKMRSATPEELKQRAKNRKDAVQGKGEGTPQRKKGGDLKKAGLGCSIAEFKKKFAEGGSLNRIPFYQGGTSKNGIIKILTEPILKEHDKYYNDYALKSPTSTKESNIAKQYFSSTPTIGNLINGAYHYIKSDPLNIYGFKMGIKQDFRKAKRKDQIKYPILSRLIYGE